MPGRRKNKKKYYHRRTDQKIGKAVVFVCGYFCQKSCSA